MNRRPIAVTVSAWLLIAVGIFGFGVHLKEIFFERSFHLKDLSVPMANLAASALGFFILKGHNWARWLALAWMALHVAISLFEPFEKAAMHIVLFGLIAYALFRRDAKVYFDHPGEAGT